METKQYVHPGDSPTARKVRRLLERDGDLCHYCCSKFNAKLPATLEHIVPRSLYGSNRLDNLVLACQLCNRTRSSQPYGEFKDSMLLWLAGEGPDPRKELQEKPPKRSAPDPAPVGSIEELAARINGKRLTTANGHPPKKKKGKAPSRWNRMWTD